MGNRSSEFWDAVKVEVPQSPQSPEAQAAPERPYWEAVKSGSQDADPSYYPTGERGENEPPPQLSGFEQFAQQASGAIATPIAKGIDYVGEAVGADPQIEELLKAGGTIPTGRPTSAAGQIGKAGTEMGMMGLGAGLAVPKIAARLLPALSSVEGGGALTSLLQMVLGTGRGRVVGDIVPAAARAVGTSPVVKSMTAPMPLAMEARAAAGGGYGAATAGEATRAAGFPEHAAAAEMLGGIPGALGAVTGPRAIVEAIQGGVAHGRRRVPPFKGTEKGKAAAERFYEEQATEAAAERLRQGQNVPAENIRRIQAAREVQEQLPGTEFSTAQATGDLAYRTQISEATKRDPAYSGRIQRMQEKTQAALKTEMGRAAPAPGGAESLRKRIQTGADKTMAELDERLAQVSQQVDAKLRTVGEKADYSEDLARGVNEELVPWFRGKADEMYSPLEEFGNRFRLPMQKIKAAVSLTAGKVPQAQVDQMKGLPSSVKSAIDAPEEWSFHEVRGLRIAMNADIQNLRPGSPGANPNALRLVQESKKALDNSLLEMQQTGQFVVDGADPQIVKTMWQEADAFYKKGMDRIADGTVGKVSGLGKGVMTAPEDAARALVRSGTAYRTRIKELDDLTTYMRGEGLAVEADAIDEAVKGYLTKDAYDAGGFGVENKTVKAGNLAGWRKNNQEALKHYPELNDHLKDVESAQRLFETAGVAHKTSTTEHARSLSSTFLKKDVGEEITTVLSHPDPKKAAGQLLLKAGDSPEAKEGMLGAIYDHMMKKAYKDVLDEGLYSQAGGAPTIKVLDPGKIADVADEAKYEPLIEMLGGTKHLERWKAIMRAAKRSERTGIAQSTRLDPEDAVSKPLITQYTASRVGRSIYGKLKDPYTKVDAGIRIVLDRVFETFPDAQANAILKRALAEPDFAETLLKRDTPEMRAAIEKMLAPDVNIAPVAAAIGAESLTREPQPAEVQP